ncbi:MAG: trypsin-like peptidase domain-containing protein [Flavobacteriales bacterium]
MINFIKSSVFASLVFTFFACHLTFIASAQLSYGGQPNWSFDTEEIPAYRLPAIDRVALDAADAVTDQVKEAPWRFGVEFDVDISPSQDGLWTVENGERVWRMRFDSPGALAISFFLDAFEVPKGAKLFLWSTDRVDFIGSFDHRNNKEWGSLALGQTAGESVVMEYHEPLGVEFEGVLHVGQIIHSYRSLYRHAEELQDRGPYGDSGACNINVNCPEGATWSTESKSVALILQGGFAACTGALVNNTLQDGTPYFLTANHCLGNPNNWIYLFNHEIEGCTGSTNNAPTTDNVSGGTLKASNSGSDFALIELSETPPASYNVQFAGWDASDDNPSSVTCIHHPSGDVKKICFDEDGPNTQSQGGAAVWYISQWEAGVTEPGSSGSPLFDQDHRVVGQLYGGTAACSGSVNNGQPDWYGRFGVSWDGTSASTRLRDWLDPNNSGTLVMDGWPEGSVSFAIDAGIQVLGMPGEVLCGVETIEPSVTITNMGTETLNSATIYYSLNGASASSIDWTGSLAQYEADEIQLPALTISDGTNELEVWLEDPNGGEDENSLNNTITETFTSFAGPTFNFQLVLILDDYGSEVTWELRRLGQVVYTGGPYQDDLDGTEVVVDLCLEEGCYIFEIDDSYGDGLCCEYGEGSWNILDPDGDLVASGGEFTDSEQEQFCTSAMDVGLTAFQNRPVVFPNPTQDVLTLMAPEWEGANWNCFDASGRRVAQGQLQSQELMLTVDHWTSGFYHLVLSHPQLGVQAIQWSLVD